jgi:hypothetical protein
VNLAKQLKPGQSEYLSLMTDGGDTGLKVQIRRVAEETQATVGEGNPFSVKLAIGAAA